MSDYDGPFALMIGDKIFVDWVCVCGFEFSASHDGGVKQVLCPDCGRWIDATPVRDELERVKQRNKEVIRREARTGTDTN